MAIGLYFVIVKPKIGAYRKLFQSYYPLKFTFDSDLQSEFLRQIGYYEQLKKSSVQVEEKIQLLSFPYPQDITDSDSQEIVFNKLFNVINKESLAFVGKAQFILSVFPIDKIPGLLTCMYENIPTHTSQAVAENIASIQTIWAEGIISLQSEEMIKCINDVSLSVGEYLNNSESYDQLQTGFIDFDVDALSSSFLNEYLIADAPHPSGNLFQHLKEITDAWAHHSTQASQAIYDHWVNDFDADFSFHFPFIALIFSGYREANLLIENKTTFDNSLKNISLDILGSGLGAWGGSQLGVAIGTAIFPGIGSVIGGLLGGVFGAMGGRYLTREVKYIPLKNAVSDYQLSYENTLFNIKNLATVSVKEMQKISNLNQVKYIDNVVNSPKLDPKNFEIDQICNSLSNQLIGDILEYERSIYWLKKSLFAKLPKFKRRLREIDFQILNLKKRIPNKSQITQNPIASLRLLIGLAYFDIGVYKSLLLNSVEDLKNANSRFATVLFLWVSNCEIEYNKGVEETLKAFEIPSTNFSNKCAEWKNELKYKEGIVKTERGKLGI